MTPTTHRNADVRTEVARTETIPVPMKIVHTSLDSLSTHLTSYVIDHDDPVRTPVVS